MDSDSSDSTSKQSFKVPIPKTKHRKKSARLLKRVIALYVVFSLGLFGLKSISKKDSVSFKSFDMTTQTIALWPDGSPQNQATTESNRPKMEVYLPKGLKNKAPMVLICPGGGYNHLSEDKEGRYWARQFAQRGYVAAVLFYRLKPHYYPAPFADATRAVRLLKSKAAGLHADSAKVFVMGFSAGGHLASTVATIPHHHLCPHDDLAPSISAHVQGAILAYPVITLGAQGHQGSKYALLGRNPDASLVDLLSNHQNVGPNTPPVFLFHTAEDNAVVVQNSLMFAQACAEHQVPVECHIFPKGRHGIGAAPDVPGTSQWPNLMFNWLQQQR